MPIDYQRPLLGFVAYSGTGKTTLLEKLIPLLKERGIRLGIIKHAHHDFDIDTPGKDSYRLRKAGAAQTMIASAKRWALVNEHDKKRDEPSLAELLPHLDTDCFDLLLVEGFKHENFPKIELWRRTHNKPLLYPDDKNIIALACDRPPKADSEITHLDLNDVAAIAEYIIDWMARMASTRKTHNR